MPNTKINVYDCYYPIYLVLYFLGIAPFSRVPETSHFRTRIRDVIPCAVNSSLFSLCLYWNCDLNVHYHTESILLNSISKCVIITGITFVIQCLIYGFLKRQQSCSIVNQMQHFDSKVGRSVGKCEWNKITPFFAAQKPSNWQWFRFPAIVCHMEHNPAVRCYVPSGPTQNISLSQHQFAWILDEIFHSSCLFKRGYCSPRQAHNNQHTICAWENRSVKCIVEVRTHKTYYCGISYNTWMNQIRCISNFSPQQWNISNGFA